MGEIEYYDFTKPECQDMYGTISEDLCLQSRTVELEELTSELLLGYDTLELTDKDLDYLRLVGEETYADYDHMGVLLKLDRHNSRANYETGALPYQKLMGVYDLVFQMLHQEHLGILFQTVWDSFQSEGSMDRGFGCSELRSGCYWPVAKDAAIEYFIARKKRSKLIFNMDTQVLENGYQVARKRLSSYFKLPLSIIESGEEVMAELRQGKPVDFLFNTKKASPPLYPYSQTYSYFTRDIDKFYKEETESFFLEDNKDWSRFMDLN